MRHVRKSTYVMRELLAYRAVFVPWFKLRYWFFRWTRGVRVIDGYPDQTRDYSRTQSALTVSRIGWNSTFRTQRLIRLLDAVLSCKELSGQSLREDARVLCIGPRGESELLLLRIFGFPNVEGIDLVSYSPLVRRMDMHHLDYDASQFDVIFASHSLGKAHDLSEVAKEIIRVTRPGAYCVVADSINISCSEIARTPFSQGLLDFFEPFRDHLGEMFWQERLPDRFSTVFTIRK